MTVFSQGAFALQVLVCRVLRRQALLDGFVISPCTEHSSCVCVFWVSKMNQFLVTFPWNIGFFCFLILGIKISTLDSGCCFRMRRVQSTAILTVEELLTVTAPSSRFCHEHAWQNHRQTNFVFPQWRKLLNKWISKELPFQWGQFSR